MIDSISEATQSTPHSANQSSANQAATLHRIIAELSSLSSEDRRRILETVATFFGINPKNVEALAHDPSPPRQDSVPANSFKFSDEIPSPKSFLLTKSPKTDVERVACLAYYLAHHRATPHFKTKDITDLNTESAHKKFSNTADAVDNASKLGYLVSSIKGAKQLSALGEQYVEALPERDAAREIFQKASHRRGGGPVRRDFAKTRKE